MVKEDHAVQLLTLQYGPGSTLLRVHLVVAVPGPLHRRLAFPCGQPAVHVSVDVAEVKLAASFLVELEEALLFFVDKVLVPGAHRDDAPTSGERGHGLAAFLR